jgi:hypothetical protein
MAVFAAFVLRLILVVATGGCLLVLVGLIWLTYRDRSTLAAQRYGARVRQEPAEQSSTVQLRSVETLPHALRTTGPGLGGRARRRAA